MLLTESCWNCRVGRAAFSAILSTTLKLPDDLYNFLPGQDALFLQDSDKCKHLIAVGDNQLLQCDRLFRPGLS